MKAAFSVWNARIAPVFDTARQVHIVEAESGRIVAEADEALPGDLPAQQVMRLAELGVGTLVCGAISWPLHGMVTASGIQVIPFVTGTVTEVVQAWLGGTMGRERFLMPGCRRRGGPAAGTPGPKTNRAGRRGRGGAGRGGGWGQSPGEPHGRGVSCAHRTCPVCGAQMIRTS